MRRFSGKGYPRKKLTFQNFTVFFNIIQKFLNCLVILFNTINLRWKNWFYQFQDNIDQVKNLSVLLNRLGRCVCRCQHILLKHDSVEDLVTVFDYWEGSRLQSGWWWRPGNSWCVYVNDGHTNSPRGSSCLHHFSVPVIWFFLIFLYKDHTSVKTVELTHAEF
jgi:hypothetical protein